MMILEEAPGGGRDLRAKNLSLIHLQEIMFRQIRQIRISKVTTLMTKDSWFHASFSTLSVKHRQAKLPSLHIRCPAPQELNSLHPMSAGRQVIGQGEVARMILRRTPVGRWAEFPCPSILAIQIC